MPPPSCRYANLGLALEPMKGWPMKRTIPPKKRRSRIMKTFAPFCEETQKYFSTMHTDLSTIRIGIMESKVTEIARNVSDIDVSSGLRVSI
jgi:hypothetical protein